MPSTNNPHSDGYRFKDGRLMIFQEEEVMLIRGWDEPSALLKSCGCWDPFVPEFRLVAPYRRSAKSVAKKMAKSPRTPPETGQMNFDLFEAGSFSPKPPVRNKTPSLTEQRKRAFDSFRFSLPKEVARVLEGFRSHQWHLLTMLAYDKHVLDLAQTNPVLAYAVADWFADHPSTRRELGRMKQRELLALLKLPDTEALVKLMRKIPPESIDRRLWNPLLSVLRHPDGFSSKFLAHVPVINLGVMELILTPPVFAALSPPLLSEVAGDPKENYRASAAALFRDILAMKAELNDNRPLNAIPSLARLREWHDAVSTEFHKLEKLRASHGPLPPPPLPGVAGRIIPLRSQSELLAEGREQKNCVAGYTARVVAGQCYIYKVLYPARATLSISRQPDGNWGIALLEASCNRKIDQATRDFVTGWLDQYRMGI
jgi:hypothetical protein